MSCAGLAPFEGRDPFKWRFCIASFHCLYAWVLSPLFSFPFFIPHRYHQSQSPLLLCVHEFHRDNLQSNHPILRLLFKLPPIFRLSQHSRYVRLTPLIYHYHQLIFSKHPSRHQSSFLRIFSSEIIIKHSIPIKPCEKDLSMDSTSTRCKL